jgi:nucleotide sugar dehydrogenase
MFDLAKIGIVGLGFVGEAVKSAYEDKNHHIVCIDVDPKKNTGTYDDLLDCEAVFVCVPSPSKENGDCDTSILNAVLYFLKDYKNVIISKTTAPPEFYEKISKVYPNLTHVPEFLTAADAKIDFLNQPNIIIGGTVLAYQREAERILKAVQPIQQARYTSIGEAAFIKYAVNCFLATKVVFMNELAQLAEAHGYQWRDVAISLRSEPRLGLSHLQVPGPDGQYGFGGHCFPKDTSAFIKYAQKFGVQLSILKTAVKKNILFRLQKPK